MTEIIAEAGVAHGGNYNRALDYIYAIRDIGVKIAKFQFYYTDTLCLNRNDFSAYDLLNKIRMHPSWIPMLAKECDRYGIEFMCSSFCRYSAEEIAPYVKRFKIASPEACNLDFVKYVSSFGKPLIISTGKLSDAQLDTVFSAIGNPITLLYCVSKYPSSVSDYDLSNIDRLRDKYKCPVGISDHSKGISVSINAVKQHGAVMVEKHIKLDNKCVDGIVSLYPAEFQKMTNIIGGKDGEE